MRMRIREWELVQGQSALPFWLRLGRFWPLGKQFLPWERNWAKPSGGSTWTRDLDSWLHCTRPSSLQCTSCWQTVPRAGSETKSDIPSGRSKRKRDWSVFQKLSLELIDHQATYGVKVPQKDPCGFVCQINVRMWEENGIVDGLLVEAVQAVVHTFADLHKKELGGKGGGRVLFFSSRHALHQHRPAGNLCLPKKTVFLPSFKKALCDRPPLESKCSQRKWKICCAQRKRAWQSMTCEEKRFSKSELSSEESDELFFSASQRFYISPLQWALGRHCIKIGTKDEKGEKIRLWRAYALCPFAHQSKINLHHHSPPGQLMFSSQDLEVVADQGEEESEEGRMDPAWTFLTSSAPLDLSLLKEGFQGEKSTVEKGQNIVYNW